MLRAAKAKPWLSIIVVVPTIPIATISMVVPTIPIPTTIPIATIPILVTIPIPIHTTIAIPTISIMVPTIPIPPTIPIATIPIVGTVPIPIPTTIAIPTTIPTTIPIPIGMVPIPIPIVLCDLHLAVFGRRSLRGSRNSRGVGARLQGERGIHGPVDCIGRHGRLRRGHSRNRTNCRYQTYDCLIHTLLLWVTGSTGSTGITTNVLAPPLLSVRKHSSPLADDRRRCLTN